MMIGEAGRYLDIFLFPPVLGWFPISLLWQRSWQRVVGIVIAPKKQQASDLLEGTMSFGLYVIGFLVMIAGLIYGATILHISTHWIVVGTVVLVGFGILSGVKATRQKDPNG